MVVANKFKNVSILFLASALIFMLIFVGCRILLQSNNLSDYDVKEGRLESYWLEERSRLEGYRIRTTRKYNVLKLKLVSGEIFEYKSDLYSKINKNDYLKIYYNESLSNEIVQLELNNQIVKSLSSHHKGQIGFGIFFIIFSLVIFLTVVNNIIKKGFNNKW